MRLISLIFLFSLFIFSCKEKIFTSDVNCSECYYPKPDSADIKIDLTINDQFDTVPLVIYRGDVEGNDIEYVDTAYSTPYYLYVAVDKLYSVKAKYRKADRTLFAIDGTKIKVLLVTDACDQECYVIRNDDMNAAIRSDFLDF